MCCIVIVALLVTDGSSQETPPPARATMRLLERLEALYSREGMLTS